MALLVHPHFAEMGLQVHRHIESAFSNPNLKPNSNPNDDSAKWKATGLITVIVYYDIACCCSSKDSLQFLIFSSLKKPSVWVGFIYTSICPDRQEPHSAWPQWRPFHASTKCFLTALRAAKSLLYIYIFNFIRHYRAASSQTRETHITMRYTIIVRSGSLLRTAF